MVITATTRPGQLSPEAGHRLAAFAELAATAIASAQAQAELAASRARIAAAADETRRRIERDLHDGAQQRLVTLVLQLRAARETVPPGLEDLRAELGRVAAGLAGALEELREYARGIHPAILAYGGLAAALQALARRSPLPATLDVQLAGRLPERVEVTAYYVVSEALANAAKHAGASAVHIDLGAAGDVLQLAVRDDGGGGADPARGSGLAGLHDRVEAIGGTLSVRSRPGEGTTLRAELPVRLRPSQWRPRTDANSVSLAGHRRIPATVVPGTASSRPSGTDTEPPCRSPVYSLPVLKSALLLRIAESTLQFSGWTLSQRLPLPSSLPSWSSRRNHCSALLILLG